MNRIVFTGWILAAGLLCASGAQALTTVRFMLADPGVAPGDSTTLEIRADFDVPVLGFGIDLVLDPGVLSPSGAPTIGAAWTPAFAPDGDGLVGLAPITGIVGPDVLLASLTVMRTSGEATVIDGAITPGDLTEGFPLLSNGFDAVVFEPTAVAAIPEPATALLVAGGLAILAGSGGGRRRLSRSR
jgi:hypothetical protein